MRYQEIVTRVNEIIRQYDMPLTLRQIYYRLVAAGAIPNRRTAYNGLSAQLVTARERNEVDESRIVDRSRRIEDPCYDSPQQFLRAAEYTIEHNYMRRFWTSQSHYLEVWVEKDALSQVIAGAVYGLNTIVAPSRGYSSYTYLKDAAARLARYGKGKERAIILHLADHDPSGRDMSRDLGDRLREYSRVWVDVHRVALTIEQVRRYDLIPNPAKITDSRAEAYIREFGDECWELDAIEPDELVRLCQEAVTDYIQDEEAWEEAKKKDQEVRARLKETLRKLAEDMKEENNGRS